VLVLWKTVCQFLPKLNIALPYDPAVALLGIHPREVKTYVHKEAPTPVFMAALLIIVKKGTNPNVHQLMKG
jgi:hypothetical protein